MKITIKEIEYNLKYTLRALFIYEQITSKQFEMKSIIDEYLFFYCTLLANNPSMNLSFDELIECCDSDMELIYEFKTFLTKEYEKQALFIQDKIDAENDKKKH